MSAANKFKELEEKIDRNLDETKRNLKLNLNEISANLNEETKNSEEIKKNHKEFEKISDLDKKSEVDFEEKIKMIENKQGI